MNVEHFHSAAAFLGTAEYNLGNIFPVGLSMAELTAKLVMAEWGNSTNGGAFDVIYVPEPATMVLLGIGGLVALRRRR